MILFVSIPITPSMMQRTTGWFLVLTTALFLYQMHLLTLTCPLQSFTSTPDLVWQEPRNSIITPSRQSQQHHGQIENPQNPTMPFSLSDDWLLPPHDSLLSRAEWDLSPIVVEEFHLIFFTQAKVGCTVWKQLFRRMMGYSDWKAENCCGMLPWNPRTNGLSYLYHYNRTEASRMLQDTQWTKAIFVRDPVERFVSAWLDKAVSHDTFLYQHCCRNKHIEWNYCWAAKHNITAFVELVRICDNGHWRPQSRRLPDPSYWDFITFVGRMETVADDAERLLRNVGAWERYGKSGWGTDGNQSIFQGDTGRKHATSASRKLNQYLTDDLDRQLRSEIYVEDYQHIAVKH